MKNLKIAFFTSLIVFVFHYLAGIVFVHIMNPDGVVWMNPFLMFLFLFWVYFLIAFIYVIIINITKIDKWLIASILMLIALFGMYFPFIIEGTFIRNFMWRSVVLIIITIPILVFSSKFIQKKLDS
ncbi:hypothetical protein [Marinigracilibium pacificum]|uniref:Uncharacterized protein n=1 Tax=Marinigracilibium pacificum TaxID=2729599 RepID=A0A848IU65_9BACT|nr:hypothetical protein [Marinigracilibium pacificum]NMM46845.1 hypothetical protein [Marinigracilibium pacificum]